MGRCLSVEDWHGNILGYTMGNDMKQGTGYERLMYRWWFDDEECTRYYWTTFEYMPGMTWGWCKSYSDQFFNQELYQFHYNFMDRDCWFLWTESLHHLKLPLDQSTICYILPVERNGNGLCATINNSIVPMYFLPYIIGL
eukprot:857_1